MPSSLDALTETDLTVNTLIERLPSGQDVFYRIRFENLFSPTIVGEPMPVARSHLTVATTAPPSPLVLTQTPYDEL